MLALVAALGAGTPIALGGASGRQDPAAGAAAVGSPPVPSPSRKWWERNSATVPASGLPLTGTNATGTSHLHSAPPLLLRYGLRAAGGLSLKSDIQTFGVSPYAGLRGPPHLDRWLGRRGISAVWMVEAWAAYLRDDKEPFTTQSFELGLNPVLVRLLFNSAGTILPYLEAGEGVMYIDLRGQDLGTRVQFASQAGAGVELRLGERLGLELGYRYRHLSNLGMASNPGVNTHLGIVGLTYRLR